MRKRIETGFCSLVLLLTCCLYWKPCPGCKILKKNMQFELLNSLFSRRLRSLNTALKTTLLVSTIRTICCARAPETQPVAPDSSLGHRHRLHYHNNQCRTKHTLPRLADVCVWKPPTRYCQPAWCHPQHGNMPESHFCKRCYMTEEELLKDPDCPVDDLKKIFDNKKAYIIDCRRAHELQETGKIPGAVNIPLDVFENALKMDDDEFKKHYGNAKPEIGHDHLVINCRSGVRSLTALKIARNLGYHRSKHLPGGFLLWKEKYSENIASVN